MDRKQEQVRRHLESAKHHKTREERKAIERLAAERKAQRQARGPRRKRGFSEEDSDFEPEARRGSRGPERKAVRAAESRAGAVELAERLVVGLFPGRATVAEDGIEQPARLDRDLAATQKSSVAVGDRVLVEARPGSEAVVREVLPRTSFLSRPDPARPDVERVVAANVDVALIAVAAKQPEFRPRLIDRYLVATKRGGVEPVVVVTKCDLLDAGERLAIQEQLEAYGPLGVRCVLASSENGEGLEEVRSACAWRTAVAVGQSGVGKSSLLVALHPELELVTGRVREGDGKGRHTTTSSRLVNAGGTAWIDTPGIRSFGLAGLGPEDLAEFFDDFAEPAGRCRFRDCRHTEEPGCEVRAAAEDGTLDRRRYGTYLRLLASLE